MHKKMFALSLVIALFLTQLAHSQPSSPNSLSGEKIIVSGNTGIQIFNRSEGTISLLNDVNGTPAGITIENDGTITSVGGGGFTVSSVSSAADLDLTCGGSDSIELIAGATQLAEFSTAQGWIKDSMGLQVTPAPGAFDADYTAAIGDTLLHAAGAANSFTHVGVVGTGANANGAAIYGAKTRATGTDANTIVQVGDSLLNFGAYGADGGN